MNYSLYNGGFGFIRVTRDPEKELTSYRGYVEQEVVSPLCSSTWYGDPGIFIVTTSSGSYNHPKYIVGTRVCTEGLFRSHQR